MQRFQRSVASFFAVATILLAAAATAAAENSYTVALPAEVISRFENSAVDFRSRRSRANFKLPKFNLPLRVQSGAITAELESHDIRSSDYKAELTGNQGTTKDPIEVDLFTGKIVGGQYARFALIRNNKSGAKKLRGFFLNGGKFYDVTQHSTNELVVEELTADEVNRIVASCGTARLANNGRIVVERHSGAGAAASPESLLDPNTLLPAYAAAGTVKVAEIASEADFEMSQAAGSGSSANAEFLAIINSVSAVYEAQLGIRFSVTFQHAWTTSSQPYSGTDSSALLDQFDTYWQANFSAAQRYDVAHFRTGRDLDSNIIGLAWLNAVCSGYRYGLSQRLGSAGYDVPLITHEVGHNFGSNHDTCSGGTSWVMCPYLIANETDFSPESKTAIAGFVGAISCLTTVTDPAPPAPPSNNPPVLGAIGGRTVNENQNVSFSLSATDADGDALTYSSSALPAGASLSGQSFSYTPGYGVVNGVTAAVTNVTFTVTDSHGAADSETVAITINNVNRPPVLTNPGPRTGSEGSVFSLQLSASDPDGEAVTYTAPVTLPAGMLLNPSTGLITWIPAGNQAGTYNIALRASDTWGAASNQTLNLVIGDVSGVPSIPTRHSNGNFDGAGGADLSVFRGITGEWFSRSLSDTLNAGAQFGLPGDIPVPADYNGDRITDRAVYRPSTNSWFISYSLLNQVEIKQFGLSGDIPAAADYDGDGRADPAVFRPATGQYFFLRSSDGGTTTVALGAAGDIPIPCDYDGDGKADVALFRPIGAVWQFHYSSTGADAVENFGASADIPVPGDYDGNGRCDAAVWRPADGSWYIAGAQPIQFGLGGDVPVPADYNGDGTTDLMVFRPGIGGWYLRQGGSAEFRQLGLYTDAAVLREPYHYAARQSRFGGAAAAGVGNDGARLYRKKGSILTTVRAGGVAAVTLPLPVGAVVVPGDYDGDRVPDTAVFQNGWWTIYRGIGGVITVGWGIPGDKPVAADFDGDGKTDIAVYRPNNGNGFSAWYVIKSSDGFAAVYNWGLPTDEPIPADFNGDGWADPAIWRPSDGTWYVIDGRSGGFIQSVQWGLGGDQPRALDFDGDGRADKVVFRPALGVWFVAYSSGSGNTIRWGQAGDTAVPGAYVSGGRNDFAVWRPAAKSLFILSTDGTTRIVKTAIPATDQVIGYAPYVGIK